MSRPTLEVGDIVRASGNRFWEHYGSHLAWQHRKVLDAIVRCRTAAAANASGSLQTTLSKLPRPRHQRASSHLTSGAVPIGIYRFSVSISGRRISRTYTK